MHLCTTCSVGSTVHKQPSAAGSKLDGWLHRLCSRHTASIAGLESKQQQTKHRRCSDYSGCECSRATYTHRPSAGKHTTGKRSCCWTIQQQKVDSDMILPSCSHNMLKQPPPLGVVKGTAAQACVGRQLAKKNMQPVQSKITQSEAELVLWVLASTLSLPQPTSADHHIARLTQLKKHHNIQKSTFDTSYSRAAAVTAIPAT